MRNGMTLEGLRAVFNYGRVAMLYVTNGPEYSEMRDAQCMFIREDDMHEGCELMLAVSDGGRICRLVSSIKRIEYDPQSGTVVLHE